ncbi:cupin domain-containing protein [Sulfuricurvum sp.]|uniref:cupin domain-containing protein n=1 Tax=Sulfuricurvum sp. TaxID=2025608 RepID=UPI003C3EE8F6
MNSDYDQRVLIDTNALSWELTEQTGVFKKLLSSRDDTETALIELKENAVLNPSSKINSVELLVLEGSYINAFGEFPQGTYLRLGAEDEASVRTDHGCIVFRKINYFDTDSSVMIHTPTTAWLSGQGNLQVLPLHDQTALVKWPANERFLPHKHWGGEEILVLSGVFMDEHGKYPQGCWIRSPHLSHHYPYVEEETIILVKTGHL